MNAISFRPSFTKELSKLYYNGIFNIYTSLYQNSSRKLESALMQLAVKLAMTVQSIIHDIL